MVSLWIIIGLIIATVSVSVLGASFSVVGIGALFSGALMAVWAMAISLEFAKFVLAAYVHQRWLHLNRLFKSYLVFAIVVLSLITSMGIFGFLSDAYQSASSEIDTENIKLESLKAQKAHNLAEIDRLNKAIDEIPENRISKRMKARAEAEPAIAQLTKNNDQLISTIAQSDLKMVEIKKRVGPLIYIARAFKIEIDTVVKYLILVFVSVFDPLAICLVIATNQALDTRRKKQYVTASTSEVYQTEPEVPVESVVEQPQPELAATDETTAAPQPAAEDIIQMRFSDLASETATDDTKQTLFPEEDSFVNRKVD